LNEILAKNVIFWILDSILVSCSFDVANFPTLDQRPKANKEDKPSLSTFGLTQGPVLKKKKPFSPLHPKHFWPTHGLSATQGLPFTFHTGLRTGGPVTISPLPRQKQGYATPRGYLSHARPIRLKPPLSPVFGSSFGRLAIFCSWRGAGLPVGGGSVLSSFFMSRFPLFPSVSAVSGLSASALVRLAGRLSGRPVSWGGFACPSSVLACLGVVLPSVSAVAVFSRAASVSGFCVFVSGCGGGFRVVAVLAP
jgi:hypothetical protein